MPLFLPPLLSGALSFISRPPGSWIASVIAVLLGIWWVNDSAYNRGFAKAVSEQRARVIIKTVERVRATYQVRDRSDERTEKSKTINERNRSLTNAIAADAAARPDTSDVCVAPDLADRLRAISHR
jgi:hypothetical protein